ncbi:peptide ABC transporter substrate-binding protein [Sulfurospirillum diekertiae]|uniref:Peptide ABC transporter substrate-binding protein n=1 Tax=Sulfurospirillum diekertiae TaxID=1854492 RepID=A0A6G9VRN0_9BACT|nr:peptide-binding protein [Sulfurospirillum diekertiae]QIR75526.1 peptide ABC transporter substrate-binding protein [Sulfurospirillum diekertiae]QIR78177.1 peptide ABC transporter substrate-binding protein [Sulfurospirillum diekertiae]
MKTLLLTLFFFTCNVLASTLHLAISANPSRLNPIVSTDKTSSDVAQWIFNGLIKYDKDANIVPDLAQSYHFVDDTTLIFELKKDVTWSDGVPFTAKDVLFTYETIISPKIFTPYSSGFMHILHVKMLDEFTVEVKYKYPYFKALEVWMMEILPEHLLKNEADLMTSKFNQAPIGTGPYTLSQFNISKDIVLAGNQNYFIHKPTIDTMIFHYLPDPSSEFLMLKSQKLDVGSLSPLQLERQIDKDFKAHYSIYEDIAHNFSYMGFNLKSEKFKDPRVREALSLAIDRQELVDILYFGHGKVCTGPFLPGTGAFNEAVHAPKPDIEKAKALLKKAGYDEAHPFEFELSTSANGSGSYSAQILQHQLKKAGVVMKLRIMEWQAFLNTVITPRKFEAVLMGWSLGLKPDAYSIWHSESMRKGGFNFIGYENAEVDQLITQAEQIVDQEKFDAIYREIFAKIVADNPYLFLVIPNSITVVNKEITPVSTSIIGVMHNTIDWIKP